MGKIKGWTKISNNRWRDDSSNGMDVQVVKKPKSNVWAVFKVMGDENFGYLDYKMLSPTFRNKDTAIAYAMKYMRSN